MYTSISERNSLNLIYLIGGFRLLGRVYLFLLLSNREELIFLKGADPGLLFVYFVLFKHNFTEKTVGFSGIQTRIIRLEGVHCDHLTTNTTPPPKNNCYLHNFCLNLT